MSGMLATRVSASGLRDSIALSAETNWLRYVDVDVICATVSLQRSLPPISISTSSVLDGIELAWPAASLIFLPLADWLVVVADDLIALSRR